jgi:hypothetical protein
VHHLTPFIPVRLPQERTEYLTARPSLLWERQLLPSDDESAGTWTQFDVSRIYRPGQRVSEDWNSYPLHAGVTFSPAGVPQSAGSSGALPSGARQGDILVVDTTPFSDNVPGHTGFGLGAFPPGTRVSGSFEVDQNGRKIAGGQVPHFSGSVGALVTLTPRPSTVRFVLGASRTGPSYPLSTRTRTVWTWRSAHESGTTLPLKWQCFDGSQHCRVEPMMTLEYRVAGLGLDGSARRGRQVLAVSAGHLQLARSAKITRAAVRVSFDDGRTWRSATVTRLGGGRYRAAYAAPSAARYVTLRVTAADAAGGQITETITRAYRLAS